MCKGGDSGRDCTNNNFFLENQMAKVIQNNEGEWVLRDDWTIDDVRTQFDDNGMDDPARITDEDCINILKILADQHDANVGINWDAMSAAIETYFEAIGSETPIYIKGEPLTVGGVEVWK
jgi:hypothetical protein